jgi:Ca2+/Na+ antiporter
VKTFFQDIVTAQADGVEFEEPKVSRLTPTATGADGSFGFRVTTAVTAEGQSIPFTLDLLAFGKDRTTVGLSVFGVGTSVPEAERDALFAKLVERGTANAL